MSPSSSASTNSQAESTASQNNNENENETAVLETQETAAVADVAAAPPPSVAFPAPTPALVTATSARTESATPTYACLPRTPAAAGTHPTPAAATQKKPKRLTGHLPPLPTSMVKQLATHIEQAGGIKKIKCGRGPGRPCRLYHLLNEHPEVYPPPGDLARRQISQLVFRWCQLDEKGQYVERVLNQFGVKSAANLRRAGGIKVVGPLLQNDDTNEANKPTSRSKKEKRKRTVVDNESSSSSDSSSSDSAANRKRDAKRKAKAKKRKSKKKRVYSSSSDDGDDSVSTRGMNDESSSLPKRTKRIKVDIDNPEWNDEIMIFTVKDIKGASGKDLYSGYYLMLPMDIRWCMVDETEEFYKARVFKRNSVLITLPAYPYSLLNLLDGTNLTRYMPDEVKNGLNDARLSFDADKANRQWKHLLLEFPSDHRLSAKEIFQDAGENGELDLEIVPFKYKAQGRKCLENWACWKVARVDVGSRKAGSGGRSRASALLKQLFVSSDSDDLEESGVV